MTKPLDELLHRMFVGAFKAMQEEAHDINEVHGFNDPDHAAYIRNDEELLAARQGLKLALIMREAGEALQAIRAGNPPDKHLPDFTSEEVELADIVIRVMNLATDDHCRLAEAIVAKQIFNNNRPFRHGGKKF